ncbi:MAG: CvpA family protein [Oscillospiraceae bacterium]|nr:CvpA family protein [Oscillospiraceae bacterium]
MSLIIDLILIAIIAFCAWNGYRKGFIMGISGILALIVAFYGAQIIADTYSQEFNSMLKPFVSGIVDSAVAKVQEDTVDTFDEEDVYGVTYDALGNIGILKSAARDIADEIANKVERTGQTMREEIVSVLSSKIAYILTVVVVFLLILIVFTVIANIINLAFKLPGLEFINELFGALFGFAKGAVIVIAIAWVMRYLGVLVDEDIVNKTVLLEWLMEHNLVTKFFGF